MSIHFPDSGFEILFFFLVLELVILLLLIVFILFRRICLYFKGIYDRIQKKKLVQILTDCMNKKKQFEKEVVFFKFYSKKNLLQQTENFNQLYKGEEWEELKDKIAITYFLPMARTLAKSYSWQKRNHAARCFALTPLQEDSKIIIALIDDPVFLVSSVAAMAAIHLEIKDAVVKIIEKMSRSWGYARYFFRDILLEPESVQHFMWIEEIASTTADLAIHLTCLDVLSGKSITIRYSFLKRDLKSANLQIRRAAVKVYAHNPQDDSAEVLLKCLEDPDKEIRAQAAYGLEFHESKECLEKLHYALSDDCWAVRLQAAATLRKFGKSGLEILQRQNPQINKNAYDVAQYVLQFDW